MALKDSRLFSIGLTKFSQQNLIQQQCSISKLSGKNDFKSIDDLINLAIDPISCYEILNRLGSLETY